MGVLDVGKNFARRLARRIGIRNPAARHRPTNWGYLAATQADIDYQIDYGIRNGELYAWRLGRMGVPVDARVMEIGPGVAFGGMAYLLAAGMRVTVSDRWLTPWVDALHTPVYAGIASRLDGEPGFNITPLLRMVAAKGYINDTIVCIHASGEELATSSPCMFDAIISNAVLEHVEDLPRALASVFASTVPGGVGLHQVDFRDHRDFDRPLEHLLLNPRRFDRLNSKTHFEFGSLRRQTDYARHIEAAGFQIENYECNSEANSAYLDSVISRLHRVNRVSDWPREVLADLGGIFHLRRP